MDTDLLTMRAFGTQVDFDNKLALPFKHKFCVVFHSGSPGPHFGRHRF